MWLYDDNYRPRLVSDAIIDVTNLLRYYIKLDFRRVGYGHVCDLKYIYTRLPSPIVGAYSSPNNTIYIESMRMTVWDVYKVMMHETLHALGLGHNQHHQSIMGKRLAKKNQQLVYARDILGLYNVWNKTFNHLVGQ